MTYTSLHWGAYCPRVENGRLVEMQPAEWDRVPSPIGASLPGAIDSPTRIRRPAVRQGYQASPGGGRERRGLEPFVEVDCRRIFSNGIYFKAPS